ncbi:hypothetical protein A6V39_03455 [Candidatus Mycoplasma haematobovis]|uniref:Lipoprotein n=1 Tax=Candidatus Mycoplasma haematobovis TaxID=432608 RepID=A0A1A9QBI0_9MOLU|nr:hypothetical protein [Candidatus Mycoplasma haematobovis]OAL09942.1 hypothetical protein A6V39_03455 [Candidatus Mycoplasma haematobovis]
MSKGVLGPTIVSCCLIGTGCFHYYSTIGRQQYTDANKSVSELLGLNHFKTVSFDNSENNTWDEIVIAYKGPEISPAEKFETVTATTNDEIREQLKKACQEIIDKPTQSLSIYNKAIRWCVIPQTARIRLQLKEKIALDISKDEKIWAGIAKQYVEKNITIDGFTLAGKNGDKELAQEMNKGCQPLLDVKNWDKDFETKSERAEKLCAIKRTN